MHVDDRSVMCDSGGLGHFLVVCSKWAEWLEPSERVRNKGMVALLLGGVDDCKWGSVRCIPGRKVVAGRGRGLVRV